MKKPMELLIDTDIGGDVDDALALALALESPELDIVGLTTVYLANEWRSGVIRRMLTTYGREDIPVALGADRPLLGRWDDSLLPAGGQSADTHGAPSVGAADFIIAQCEARPELVLVPIGPLTNMATALIKAPHVIRRHPVVMMGGMVTRARPEWNILCDPEAARILFESDMDITMIGLDVTEQCRFTEEDIRRVKSTGSPKTALLGEMMDSFVRDFGYLPVLHDPLAVAALLWDDVLDFADKRILIETRGEYSRGLTMDTDREDGGRARVAVRVKAELFKSRLLERLCV